MGNREKLLDGAMRCLRDKGYAHTTARDLVAASGANLASIGYHFGSKEALLNEAVAEGTRRWMRAVEDAAFAEEVTQPHERLRRTLATIVDRFDELAPLLSSFVEAFPPAVRSAELRAVMAQAYEDVRSAGATMLAEIFAEDEAIDERRARVLASVILAVGDGLILQWLLEPGATPSSDEIVDALAALSATVPATVDAAERR